MDVSVSLSRAKQKTFVPQRAGLATRTGKSLALSLCRGVRVHGTPRRRTKVFHTNGNQRHRQWRNLRGPTPWSSSFRRRKPGTRSGSTSPDRTRSSTSSCMTRGRDAIASSPRTGNGRSPTCLPRTTRDPTAVNDPTCT